jgi:hypothetical protein
MSNSKYEPCAELVRILSSMIAGINRDAAHMQAQDVGTPAQIEALRSGQRHLEEAVADLSSVGVVTGNTIYNSNQE